jgi:hypothetical protein
MCEEISVLHALDAANCRLSKLRSLFLNNNKLTSLPGSMGTLTLLTELNVANNPLTSLPTELGNIQKLKTLIVDSSAVASVPGGWRGGDDLKDSALDSPTKEKAALKGHTVRRCWPTCIQFVLICLYCTLRTACVHTNCISLWTVEFSPLLGS